MPIYEYHCTTCGHDFEELVFGDALPTCPACQADATEKLLSRPCRCVSGRDSIDPSTFSQAASACGSGGGGCAGCAGGNCASCH